MATLYISVSDPSEPTNMISYKIDLRDYAEQLKNRWPNAQIIQPNSLTYVLQWELNTQESLGISGGLQSDRQTVSFGSNPKENAIEFILWHRSLVPSSQYLLLFDDNMDIKCELKSDISLEKLREII